MGMRTIPLAEAKTTLSAIVHDVAYEPVTITRNGYPVAAIVDIAYLSSLEETVWWLSDPATIPELRQALADDAAGLSVSIDQVKADLSGYPRR